MDLYWVGDSGDWDDIAHWDFVSGGAGGSAVPTSSDNARFDANSFSTISQVVSIASAMAATCKNFDMTGVTNTPTVAFTDMGARVDTLGDIKIPADTIFTSPNNSFLAAYFNIQAAASLDIRSTDFDISIVIAASVTINLLHDLTARSIGSLDDVSSFTFNTNDHALNVSDIMMQGIWNYGASEVNLSNGYRGHFSFILSNNLPTTMNAGTSQINILGNGIMQLNDDVDFHDVNVENTDGGYSGVVEWPSVVTRTFHDLNVSADTTQRIMGLSTMHINHEFNTVGLPGQLITMESLNSNNWNIYAAVANTSYLALSRSHATGASLPLDDTFGGVDNGNNSGWQFIPDMTFPEMSGMSELTYDTAIAQVDTPFDFNFDTSGWDEMGVVFSDINLLPLIQLGDSFVIIFGIIGPFFVNLTNLVPGQTYYIRVYVRKGPNYYYSTVISFTVPITTAIPVIVTDNLVSKYQFEVFAPNGDLIADLSGYVTGRHFTITRNRADEITFSINIYTLAQLCTQLHITPADILKPGINEVRIRRSGVYITAGQMVYWTTNLASETIEVKIKGWLELFSYRVFSGSYVSQTAAFIARDMITQTQLLTNGNFGATLGLNPGGTNTYALKEFENKSIAEALIEFSEEDSGFDFEFTWDKVFNMYMPSIGSTRNDILFTYPGNTKDISISQDSTQIVNSLLGRGTGNANANINTIIDDLTSQGIYKLRTGIKDWPDVDEDQLLALTSGEVAFYKDPLYLRTITYDGTKEGCPPIGTFGIGDKPRMFVGQLDVFANANGSFTIDKIDVTIGESDEETVVLSLN